MRKRESLSDKLSRAVEIFVPYISVDCLVLGFDSGKIKALLCKLKEGKEWILIGGFVKRVERPDDSVYRIIKEKTGLDKVGYLKQFHFFNKECNPGDDENIMTLNRLDVEITPQNMANLQRFVGLSYYFLVKYPDVVVSCQDFETMEWFDINDLPAMHTNHINLLKKAILDIRKQIGFIPFGYELLPEKFTMPELRGIYEAILGRELDRRNFQRKMLSIGYIKPLDETRKIGAHKSPNVYTFVKEKYKEAEEEGLQIMSNNL